MTKRFLVVLIVLAFTLASCQSILGTGDQAGGKKGEVPEGTPMPDCTVISMNPTAEPTLAAIFPPTGENDWVEGEDTAFVTITEYSDFM